MNPENNPNNPSDASSEIENFPSFEEHIKSVQSAENDAEPLNYDYIFRHTPAADRPEGVRDTQDLKEYTEEREAKQAESIEKQKSIILENYNVSDEKVEALTSSEEFAAFCRSGITIDELIRKNIVIARKEDHYSSQPGEKVYDYQRESSFDDMHTMVEDLGRFYIMKENCEKVGLEPQFPAIKNYIDKLDDPTSITKEDTANIILSIHPNSGIAQRLIFGNPKNISANNVINRTAMTLDHIRDYETSDSILDKESIAEFLDLANYVIEKGEFFPEGVSDYAFESSHVKQALRPRLRQAVRAHTEDIAVGMRGDMEQGGYNGGYTDYDGLKNLVLRSTSELSIMKDHDILTQVGISEEELLDSVYGFDNEELSECKSRPEAYPDHHIARDADSLIEHGFSKNSIVDAIHDNSIYIDEYEVERMRNAGIEDEDIIYAKGVDHLAYEYNRNGDKIDNDEIEIDGVKYSQKDVLGAALKEIRYRNLHE